MTQNSPFSITRGRQQVKRASLEAMDLTLRESIIALFLAALPSVLKVRIYRMAGARIGRHVSMGFGSVVMADNFSKIHIGQFTVIRNFTFIICREVNIGAYVHIPMHVWIWGSGTLTLNKKCTLGTHVKIDLRRNNLYCGKYVGIPAGCMIYTHSHFFPYTQGWIHSLKDVILEDYVFLSMYTVVLPGVRIGKNTVIGVGSVVNRSIPQNSFAAGRPARVISGIENLKTEVNSDELRRRMIKIAKDMVDYFGYRFISEDSISGHYVITFERSTFTSKKIWQIIVTDADTLTPSLLDIHGGGGNKILFSSSRVPRDVARDVNMWFDIKNQECCNLPSKFAIDIWYFLRNTWMEICDVRNP